MIHLISLILNKLNANKKYSNHLHVRSDLVLIPSPSILATSSSPTATLPDCKISETITAEIRVTSISDLRIKELLIRKRNHQTIILSYFISILS